MIVNIRSRKSEMDWDGKTIYKGESPTPPVRVTSIITIILCGAILCLLWFGWFYPLMGMFFKWLTPTFAHWAGV